MYEPAASRNDPPLARNNQFSMTKEIPTTSIQKRSARPEPSATGRIVRLYGLQSPDGKIQILRATEGPSPTDAVDLHEARRILGLSLRQLAYLCDTGHFRTARKGPGKTCPWTISLGELIEHLSMRPA
jgi:hypothetical protein